MWHPCLSAGVIRQLTVTLLVIGQGVGFILCDPGAPSGRFLVVGCLAGWLCAHQRVVSPLIISDCSLRTNESSGKLGMLLPTVESWHRPRAFWLPGSLSRCGVQPHREEISKGSAAYKVLCLYRNRNGEEMLLGICGSAHYHVGYFGKMMSVG